MDSSNKRIAKNTLMLYIRMLISMLVGLYTSRVVLQTLGVEDYGIYTVVGGFVSMFSMISTSLQGAVSRFLVFELGTGNQSKLSTIFSTSFIIMIALSVVVILLTETIGLWYLNNKMVIPDDRQVAGFWCFQISIIAFVLQLLSTPYSASILSHERMDIYAFMSLVDVFLKLGVCYVIVYSPMDRLIFYALLILVVSLIDQIIYWSFCHRKFIECSLQGRFDGHLLSQMFGFASWSFIGSSASVLRFQGANLLLNFFGGPIVNAASGIANSVNSIVSSFVGSFTQAINPQITKRFAAKEYDSLMNLLIYGAKISYYLLFFISLPILLNTQFLLELWLGSVPEHTVVFCRLALISTLIESLSYSIIVAKSATGNIKKYQLVVGCTVLLLLPVSYVGLKVGLPVECVFVLNLLISLLSLFVRMYMLRGVFPNWSSFLFVKKVLIKVTIVSIVSSIIPLFINQFLSLGWFDFCITTIVALCSVLVSVWFLGFSNPERLIIYEKTIEIKDTIKKKCFAYVNKKNHY